MRNARNARRRSVKLGLPAALLALLIAVFVAGCGSSDDSTDSSSGSSGTAAASTWSATPPRNPSTRKPSSPASKRPRRASGVSFSNSFGASGDQSRAVVAGQPASVVHFAQAGDMERLVEEGGLVAKDWDKQPYGGIAQDSVVVITVRKGNPEGIKSFDDVLTKDVDVVTPNPFSSGAARWNIMAVYGNAINEGKSPDRGARRRQDPARKGSRRSRAAPATRSPPSPRARATCCSATRTRRSRPIERRRRRRIRRPAQHDPDRNPDRGHQGCARARGSGLPQLHLVGRRPGNLG